jgi:hypothetical protein
MLQCVCKSMTGCPLPAVAHQLPSQHSCQCTDCVSIKSSSHCRASIFIQPARSEEARAAQGQQRFSAGYKRDEVLPHTKGLRAYALAALCPQLRHFSMDERASCIGGMTDDMARALAVHCKQLAALEVYFQRYSLPSELFTDEGLIALTEGCRSLKRLTLHNCDRVSDRWAPWVRAHAGRLLPLSLCAPGHVLPVCQQHASIGT